MNGLFIYKYIIYRYIIYIPACDIGLINAPTNRVHELRHHPVEFHPTHRNPMVSVGVSWTSAPYPQPNRTWTSCIHQGSEPPENGWKVLGVGFWGKILEKSETSLKSNKERNHFVISLSFHVYSFLVCIWLKTGSPSSWKKCYFPGSSSIQRLSKRAHNFVTGVGKNMSNKFN